MYIKLFQILLINLVLVVVNFSHAGEISDESDDLKPSCARLITGYTYSSTPQARFHGYTSIAVITEVNGSPVIRGKGRFVLPVGKNILKVGHIFNDHPRKNNEFILTTKANTSYYLSYVHDAEWVNKKAEKLGNTLYTGPIVVEEKAKSCQR